MDAIHARPEDVLESHVVDSSGAVIGTVERVPGRNYPAWDLSRGASGLSVDPTSPRPFQKEFEASRRRWAQKQTEEGLDDFEAEIAIYLCRLVC